MIRSTLAVLLLIVLVACAPAQTSTPTPTPEPHATLSAAVANIRKATTFRIDIEQTGAPFAFQSYMGNIQFRRAVGQYVAPNVLEAHLRVVVDGLPTDVGLFARGPDQWFENAVATAGQWLHAALSPGFDPGFLIAGDSGFQAAVSALQDIVYVGDETLESGTSAQHFKSTAKGEEVSGLVADLVPLTGQVTVDVYVDPQVVMPVRFIVVQPDTVTATQKVPLTFTIDLYDVNAAPKLDNPDATATVRPS